MPEPASNTFRIWPVVSWAAFLACSWTWCIGMWLPVILLRDFGIWSFAAFAIPNVVGAAAMGVVLQRRGLSEWITAEHEFAAQAFSAVTIIFQLFFFLWIIGAPLDQFGSFRNIGLTAAFVGSLVLLTLTRRWVRHASIVVWLVSLLALLYAILPRLVSDNQLPAPQLPGDDLLWLTPVMIFGFLLCPYLDLTFHRARRSLPAAVGSVAFVVGFGLLFLAMILGTLGYGVMLLISDAGPRPSHLPTWLAVHVVLQLAFTIVVHAIALGQVADTRTSVDIPAKPRSSPSLQSNGLITLLCLGAIAAAAAGSFVHSGLTGTEIIYRGFMAFYGLVFPAYVWLCMLPLGTTRTPRRLWTFAGAVTLAAPFYWMGFIERETWWLVPGVAIVLLAKLIAGGAPRRASA